MPNRELDIHFPKKGISRSRPASEVRVALGPNNEKHYWCYDGVNVAGWDTFAERQRGGSRPGLTKLVNDLGQDAITQDLSQIIGSGFSPPGGNPVQPSNSGRVVTIVKVAAGYVEVLNPGDTVWSATTNSAINTPPLNASGIVYSAPNNQKMYFADGLTDRVFYTPATNVVDDWTTTAGTMPSDSGNGPRLIALWRGRTLQSGIISDPQNIFASKVSDPRDYDYSPANPAATDAWALNLSDLGVIGDVVNSLVPCTDDVLVVLGDHTIEKLVGDPNNGGSREVVSDTIGGVFGQAWCKGPDGTIYFFSNIPGVYALPPRGAGQPVRISLEIDPLIKDTNTGSDIIRFFWDDRRQGFYLYITASDGLSGNHFFYEAVRADGSGGGWFRVSYANTAHNPFCGCIIDGNEADDRAVIIGGTDGYVRMLDPSATDDDGTAIASYVLIGPINSPTGDEMILMELQAELSADSADVTMDIQVGATAEEAATATPIAAVQDTFSAGRGYTKYVNRAGHAIYIKLSSTGRWAMERLRAAISTRMSKVKRRGK